MHQFYTKQLPSSFDNFFTLLSARHPYNTRIASRNNYYLPKARTNYGIFNIRFTGAKVWNLIEISDKNLSKNALKRKLKSYLLYKY